MSIPSTDTPSGRTRRAAATAVAALWFGVLTGFVEGAVIWTRQNLGFITFASRHVIWMTVLSYLIVFAVIGLFCAITVFALPRLVTRRLAVGILAAASTFFLLLPVGWLSRYAIIPIAIGVGVQVAHTCAKRSNGMRRLARAFLAFAAIAIAITTALPWLARPFRSRAARPPDGAMNVVIVIWDTVRAKSLGLYRYERNTTPRLEEIARDGTVFENAISTSPWTLPSHTTMFTGRFPHEVSSDWFTAFDGEFETLAEWLRSGGWHTGGFVANHHYTSDDSGLDRGFDHYEDYRITFSQVLQSSNFLQTPTGAGILNGIRRRSPRQVLAAIRRLELYTPEKRTSDPSHASLVNSEFLHWLDGLDDRPFLAFLNYFDAHQPYWAPADFKARFAGDNAEIDTYDAAVAYLDQQTGALCDSLAARGLLDNTLFIVTADHGELHGEHDQHGHAANLYRSVLRVPLVMRNPETVPAGLRVHNIVSLGDLATTISGLVRPGAPFPGSTLARFFVPDSLPSLAFALAEVRPGRAHSPDVPLSRGTMTTLIGDGYQYILNGDGVEQLFDYWNDPAGKHDLAVTPDSAARTILQTIRDRIRSRLARRPTHFDGWARRDSTLGVH